MTTSDDAGTDPLPPPPLPPESLPLSPLPSEPLLSVILTVVEGGASVERVLAALAAQQDAPPLEILVPYDASIADTGALAARWPAVRFLALGHVPTEQPADTAAGEHELFDRRRAAGLAAAQGALVAIIEDRGAPRADWARTAVRLHTELPHAVIGGAIDPLPSALREFAIHVCDFTRYTSPFVRGARDWVSDVNVVYKRRALDATQGQWRERYQEPVVHWALQQAGETLWLDDRLVVEHVRRPVGWSALLGERYHWGRLFGAIHGRTLSAPARMVRVAMAPLVPLVLWQRHARTHAAAGRLVRVLAATPAMLLLLAGWSVGEATGVLTRRT